MHSLDISMMKLPITFLYLPFGALIIIFPVALMTCFNKKPEPNRLFEVAMSFLKYMGYIIVAKFIYKYYITKESIDILTYFTYLLCSFEAIHNFVDGILYPITIFLKLVYKFVMSIKEEFKEYAE